MILIWIAVTSFIAVSFWLFHSTAQAVLLLARGLDEVRKDIDELKQKS